MVRASDRWRQHAGKARVLPGSPPVAAPFRPWRDRLGGLIMNHCVRRVWPGMLAALLLAGSAFAAPAQAARAPDRHAPRVHIPHASHDRARGKAKIRFAARRRPPATSAATTRTTAFIDDGFSFSNVALVSRPGNRPALPHGMAAAGGTANRPAAARHMMKTH